MAEDSFWDVKVFAQLGLIFRDLEAARVLAEANLSVFRVLMS